MENNDASHRNRRPDHWCRADRPHPRNRLAASGNRPPADRQARIGPEHLARRRDSRPHPRSARTSRRRRSTQRARIEARAFPHPRPRPRAAQPLVRSIEEPVSLSADAAAGRHRAGAGRAARRARWHDPSRRHGDRGAAERRRRAGDDHGARGRAYDPRALCGWGRRHAFDGARRHRGRLRGLALCGVLRAGGCAHGLGHARRSRAVLLRRRPRRRGAAPRRRLPDRGDPREMPRSGRASPTSRRCSMRAALRRNAPPSRM
jgi:hypothetical protein